MSIWVTLSMQVANGQFPSLKPFLEEKLPAVRGFDGALSVTVHFDEQTNALLITEEWKSKQHHAAYIEAISQNGVMEKLVSFMNAPPDMAYYQRLAI